MQAMSMSLIHRSPTNGSALVTTFQGRDVALRDTVVPGFLCRITPADGNVFMFR